MSAGTAKPREAGMAIQVLGREYRVSCPPGEEARLQATVDLVNERIAHLRDAGRITGNERLAIMAALNIAHEFLAAKTEKPEKPRTSAAATGSGVDAGDIRRRIAAMQEALESALGADQEKLF